MEFVAANGSAEEIICHLRFQRAAVGAIGNSLPGRGMKSGQFPLPYPLAAAFYPERLLNKRAANIRTTSVPMAMPP